MRIAWLLLVAIAVLSSGCSLLIARSGKDLSAVTTKSQVRAKLGEPSASGVADGQPFEEYHTRWKISEEGTGRYMSYGMGLGMTYGTIELFAFPYELYLLGSRTLFGQTIRVTYAADGHVQGIFLDGESLDALHIAKDAPAEGVTPPQGPEQGRLPAPTLPEPPSP
jgi:hypothetical protein